MCRSVTAHKVLMWSVEGTETDALASPLNLFYSLKRVSLSFVHALYRSCLIIQIGKCFGEREKLPCQMWNLGKDLGMQSHSSPFSGSST